MLFRKPQPMKRRRIHAGRLVAVGVVTACTVGAAACSSSGGSSSSASAAGSPTQHITIALADVLGDPVSMVAQQLGYFKAENVDVKLTAAGNNTPTFVTSGQSDLAELTFVPALAAAEQGEATTIIYATNGGANGGSLFTKADVTLASLKSTPGCKIATVAQGTATFGFAQIYKQTVGLNCTTVPLANAAAQEAALASGQVNAFITTPQYLVASLQKNGLKVLIDTRDASARTQYGGPYVNAPGVGFWGLSSHLSKDRPAVVDFLKAWNKARSYVVSNPNGAVDALMQTSSFKGGPRAVAQASIAAEDAWLPTLTGSNGYVTGSQWTSFLHQAATYGLPNFSVTNPAFAYSARVDMSYYKAAIGNPGS
jgi:ABC-type nitrate/sulfonate/bicarbonate transport system substrate-binding protein